MVNQIYIIHVPTLGDTQFFRLQCIKALWRLQFLEYLRTLSSWESQQGRLRTTSILVRAFWNLKLKVLKYSKNCSLQYTLIPNFWQTLLYILTNSNWKPPRTAWWCTSVIWIRSNQVNFYFFCHCDWTCLNSLFWKLRICYFSLATKNCSSWT